MNKKIKQILVIRKDLNMRKGKVAAQAAHASMKVLLDIGYVMESEIGLPTLVVPLDDNIKDWLLGAFTKVCVSVNSEKELVDIYDHAKAAGLNCSIIEDSGLTEFNNVPTLTAVAVGPNWSDDLDKVTGHLPLL